jgi:hypothetical protein
MEAELKTNMLETTGQFLFIVGIVGNSVVLIPALTACGLMVRVLGYRSGGPGSIPSTTRKKM